MLHFQAILLAPPYQVFVSKVKLREIKRRAISATALARHLATEVFSEDACAKCTPTGRVSSSGPGVPRIQRPALDQDGVMAVYGKNRIFYHFL